MNYTDIILINDNSIFVISPELQKKYTHTKKYTPIKALYINDVLYTLCVFSDKKKHSYHEEPTFYNFEELSDEKEDSKNTEDKNMIFMWKDDTAYKVVESNNLDMFNFKNELYITDKTTISYSQTLKIYKIKNHELVEVTNEINSDTIVLNTIFVLYNDTNNKDDDEDDDDNIIYTIDKFDKFGFQEFIKIKIPKGEIESFFVTEKKIFVKCDDNILIYKINNYGTTEEYETISNINSLKNVSSCGKYLLFEIIRHNNRICILYNMKNTKQKKVNLNSVLKGNFLYSIEQGQVIKVIPIDNVLYYVLPGAKIKSNPFSDFLSSTLYDSNLMKTIDSYND